jgi:uncharacterized protein YggE
MKNRASREATERCHGGSRRRLRFIVLLALVGGVGSRAAMAQMPGEGITVSKDNRTIAITATDSVTAIADVATVHIGFQIYGVDHDSTYAAGSTLSNAIVGALKAAGVAADAIESAGQGIQPVQPYERQNFTDAEKAQRQFSLNQSWTVRAAANDGARILDVAVKAGANASGQIDWSLKDSNAPEAEAEGATAGADSGREHGTRVECKAGGADLCEQYDAGAGGPSGSEGPRHCSCAGGGGCDAVGDQSAAD